MIEAGKEFCSSYRRARELECRAGAAAALNPYSATAVAEESMLSMLHQAQNPSEVLV